MLSLHKPLKFLSCLNLKLNIEFDLIKRLLTFGNVLYETQKTQLQ